MSDYADLAARFKKILKFELEPVGVCFFKNDEAPSEQLQALAGEAGVKSYCEALIAAGRGRSFLGGSEKMGCPLGNAVLGLLNEPAGVLDSVVKEKHRAGLFAAETGSQASVSAAPKFSPGFNRQVGVGPLSVLVDQPDLVILEVTPQETMWVLYGMNFNSGGSQPLVQSGGVAGGCADIGAGIVLSDKVNVTFLGLSCRIKSGMPAEHLLIGAPAARFEGMVEALEKMSGPIAKLAEAQAGL